MVIEELLYPYLKDDHELDDFLNKVKNESKTPKVWVDHLMRPVFPMRRYVRAEREGNWALYMYIVSKMLSYFFSAVYHHYERYGTYYSNNKGKLPYLIEKFF